MSHETEAALREVAALENHQLRERWKATFGRKPPRCASRDFMILSLSWRIQELAYGGLKPAIKKRLAEMARQMSGKGYTPPIRLKPGTRLVRDWHGKSHHVTVLEEGFAYEGKTFRSLSEIARTIAGVRWSGPLFFGLKKPSRPPKEIAHAA